MVSVDKLDSYEQWHSARIGREVREAGGTLDDALVRLHGVYSKSHHADAERFCIPAFKGEQVPELDGPHPDGEDAHERMKP